MNSKTELQQSTELLNNLNSSQEYNIQRQNIKSVIIICNPNGASYEIFANSDKWVEYYLDIGVSVLLWNYRGFGESNGDVNFENQREDAECVSHFLRKFYKFDKIGVHGFSIGGIPACYLAGY